MTKPRLVYETIILPAMASNIEGNVTNSFANWKVLLVFVEGVVYNLVYEAPSEQEVRYNKVIGRFVLPDLSENDRKLTVIRKL